MSTRARRVRRTSATEPVEVEQALDALSAPELRAVVRAILDDLDEDVRAPLVDRLLGQALKAPSALRPARLSPRIVADAQAFAEAARRVGQADPDDVTEHLRRASKAFVAGDHASARAVFEAIILPIATVDIDLGQHEFVEEVLGVDAQMCVAQYVASVFTTTPLPGRVDAVLRAIGDAQGVGTLLNPIKDMEDVTAGALPDLDAFLPRWIARLRRFRAPRQEWDSEHERWLREAVGRRDGVQGLERLARTTKRPQACLAWYAAFAERGDWPAASKAAVASAGLVRQPHWRGELLDGAALAAQELGRSDLSNRLESAWRASPTLTRLLRWMASANGGRDVIRARAAKAMPRCPKTATRQLGLLRVLCGDVSGAALLLSKAPGLGWSDPEHPGHALFPLFATLLSKGDIDTALSSELEATVGDPLDGPIDGDEGPGPRLITPSVAALIDRAQVRTALTDADRDAAIDAMRVAGEKRVEGILERSSAHSTHRDQAVHGIVITQSRHRDHRGPRVDVIGAQRRWAVGSV